MFDTAVLAREKRLASVWVTNGYMSRAGLEPLCPYLDAANVDLKSFSEKTYNELNGGHLKPVLETLKILKEYGVWTEVTTLMVPGYTDNLETAKGVAGWMLKHLGPDAPLHFSRFHPAHKLERLPPTSTEILVRARETAMKMGLRYVYVGNVPGLEMENTICPGCGKTVIRRTGFSVSEINLDKGRCRFCRTAVAGRFS
jgi:pyruvate formate lyase activating enzyme